MPAQESLLVDHYRSYEQAGGLAESGSAGDSGGDGTRGCSGGRFPGSLALPFHAAQGQSKQRAGVDSKEETVTEGTRHKGEEPCFKNAQGHPD